MASFIGTGTKLDTNDYVRVAAFLDVEVAALRAVVEVEAASYGFNGKNRPRILFEPHVFYRELGAGPKRDRAVREGLAYPKWGTVPYPRSSDSRYDQLARAMQIDPEAALRSVSWGLGQVMGFNYKIAGYQSVLEFFEAMKSGEHAQLTAMAHFIKGNGLDDEMRRHDWTGFARGYNGPGYAKHGYHTKLAQAYARYAGRPGEVISDTPSALPLLTLGATGPHVSRAQERLTAYGFYRGKIDGDFGPAMKAAVEAFQQSHPSTGAIDGVIGKNTWAVLLTEPEAADPVEEESTPPPPNARPVTLGQSTIGRYFAALRALRRRFRTV